MARISPAESLRTHAFLASLADSQKRELDSHLSLATSQSIAQVVDKSVKEYAAISVPYMGPGKKEPATWVANRDEYVRHFKGTTFIAIGAIAKKMAMQKAKASRLIIEKSGERLEPLESDHPLVKLLGSPNPIHTQFDLWFQMVSWQLMTGDSYWWKARNGFAAPAELWPMPSQWVWAIPSSTKFIDSYLVRGVFGQQDTYLPAEDVVHIREPNIDWSGNGRFYGMPTAAACATAIDLEEAMFKRLYHQFKNFSPPGMHYSTDEKLTEPQFMDLLVQIRSQQLASEETGNPILSHSGMRVDELRNTVREMDYSNSLSIVMDYILAVFGTPRSVVGLGKEMGRANFVGSMLAWSENVINPRLVQTGQALTRGLAHDFEEDIVIHFDPVTVADSDGLRADVQLAVTAGATTPNEVRDVLLKKGPFDVGGDRPLISGANIEAPFGHGEIAPAIPPEDEVPPAEADPAAANGGLPPPEEPEPAAGDVDIQSELDAAINGDQTQKLTSDAASEVAEQFFRTRRGRKIKPAAKRGRRRLADYPQEEGNQLRERIEGLLR